MSKYFKHMKLKASRIPIETNNVEQLVDYRTNERLVEIRQQKVKNAVEKLLEVLDARETTVIMRRFGLLDGLEPQLLKEVGAYLGVTKERIRQIEGRALSKLLKELKEKHLPKFEELDLCFICT
jgi:DNA-directed RNA polymerase sigma subunit (sigma70/sigma32)